MPRRSTKSEVPKKPFPDFPLFAHRNGSWKKKIGGQQVSFGPIGNVSDPDDFDKCWRAAREAYNRYCEAKKSGAEVAADPRGMTLKTYSDAYLTARHADVDAGTLKPRTFGAIRTIVREYRQAVGVNRTIRDIEADPKKIELFVADHAERYGFHAFNRHNVYLRTMWNWGAKDEVKFLVPRFDKISLHRKLPMSVFRRQRRLERAAGAVTSFNPDEVSALLKFATPMMRGAVMLGYFAGYANTDVAQFSEALMKVYAKDETINILGRREVIPAGWAILDHARPKTEVDRAAIVPPCVVEALLAVKQLGRPSTKATSHLLFRTEGGRELVYDVVHRDANNLILKTTPTDNLRLNFERLIDRIGRCQIHGWVKRMNFMRGKARKAGDATAPRIRQNKCSICEAALKTKRNGGREGTTPDIEMMQPRGFSFLRHTATTFATASGASSDTRHLFEGHLGGGVRQAFYLDPTKLHDLLLIAKDLLARLENVSHQSHEPEPLKMPASSADAPVPASTLSAAG